MPSCSSSRVRLRRPHQCRSQTRLPDLLLPGPYLPRPPSSIGWRVDSAGGRVLGRAPDTTWPCRAGLGTIRTALLKEPIPLEVVRTSWVFIPHSRHFKCTSVGPQNHPYVRFGLGCLRFSRGAPQRGSSCAETLADLHRSRSGLRRPAQSNSARVTGDDQATTVCAGTNWLASRALCSRFPRMKSSSVN